MRLREIGLGFPDKFVGVVTELVDRLDGKANKLVFIR
jgi:hypothetical protein